jgi:hypothetical protein
MIAETTSAKEFTVFDKIIGVFTSPTETFTAIAKKPTWLIPFIILAVIQVGSFWILKDIKYEDQKVWTEAWVQNNDNFSDEQADRILESVEARKDPSILRLVLANAWEVARVPLLFVILTGVFLFAGNVVLGGKSNFKVIFGVAAWASIIQALSKILDVILVYFKGTAYGVTKSLAILLPAPPMGKMPGMTYLLLSTFDFFTIWKLVILAIGLSCAYQFNRNKSLGMVFIVYLIFAFVAIALSMVGAKLAGMA